MTGRNFIGREDLIRDFENHCRDGDGKIIYYTGVAGIGKTALLKYLAENKLAGFEYVYHDFDSLTNMKNVLKKLARRLSNAGFEFPLFEMGCYLYEKSTGENTFPPKQKSFLSDYPGISNIVGLASAAFTVAGTAGAVPIAFAAADFVQKNQEDILDWLDKIYSWCVKNFNLDDENARYRQYLRETIEKLKANAEKVQDENQLENQLVELFANDLAYSIRKGNRRAVIILDSYEILMLRGRKTKEHPEPDWWLKEKLLRDVPSVIWLLGGRGKLNYDGFIQRELQPFDDTVSLKFLQSRGVTSNQILCYQITKLTRGYPLYLELCAEQYRLLKKKDRYHEPDISDFAPENEDFQSRVGKIVVNLIECMDDTGIRETIKYLCALKGWTSEMAFSIIPAFNETAYNMIKNFSFVRLADKENADDEDNFRFDETVHEILIRKYKRENRFVIRRAISGLNSYYSGLIENLRAEDSELESNRDEFNKYFKTWIEAVVQLTEDPRALMDCYAKNMQRFMNLAYLYVEEEILDLIFARLKVIAAPESLPYAFFELQKSFVKNHAWHYGESLELAQSAYDKLKKLRATEDSTTVDRLILDSLRIRSNSTENIGHNEDDVALKKEIVEFSKIICKDRPDLIYNALCGYVAALGTVGRNDEATEISREILEFSRHNFGENSVRTVKILRALAYGDKSLDEDERLDMLKKCAYNLKEHKHSDAYGMLREYAEALNHFGRFDEELAIRRENWDYCRAVYGDEAQDTINAARDYSIALRELDRDDEADKILNEALENRAAAFKLHAEKLSADDPESIEILNALAGTLSELDKCADAVKVQREILERCKKVYGEHDYKTIREMEYLADSLRSAGKKKELDQLEKQISELRRAAFEFCKNNVEFCKNKYGEGHSKTIEAINNLVGKLDYDEALKLQRELVEITRRSIGKWDCDVYDYIKAIQDLADMLGECDEELELRKEALKLWKENYGGNQQTMEAMTTLVMAFKERDMTDEALALQKELVDMRVKEWGDAACETFWTMRELSEMYRDAGKFDEELEYIRWALDCAKKRGAFRKQTIYTMEGLARTLARQFDADSQAEYLNLIRELVAASTKRFGEENPHTIRAIGSLADVLSINGDAEAEQLQAKYKALTKKYVEDPNEDWNEDEDVHETFWTMPELAKILHDAENYDEELEYNRRALTCEKIHDANSKRTVLAMERVSENLSWWDAERIPLLRELVAATNEHFGENNIHTISAIMNLIDALEAINDAEAAIWQEKYEALYDKYGGEWAEDDD